MENENVVNAELVPYGHNETNPVASMVGNGAIIQRIENETLMQFAIQRPRNELALFKAAMAELSLAPKFAKKAFYSIPYKDKKTGKVTNVEGLSIKAAMALGRRWGNCTNGFRIISEDNERVIVEGVFIDMETNMRTQRTMSVSKIARFVKDGKATYSPLAPDRLNMAIQSGGSKAVRNAILASLPAALTEAYFDESKRVVAEKNPIENVYAQFAKIGISNDTISAYLKTPALTAMTATERAAHMVGIYNAIEDEQVSAEEIFDNAMPATAPRSKSEAVKAEPVAEHHEAKEPKRRTKTEKAPEPVQPETPKAEPSPAPAPAPDPATAEPTVDAKKAPVVGDKIYFRVIECVRNVDDNYDVYTEDGEYVITPQYVSTIMRAINDNLYLGATLGENKILKDIVVQK